MGGTSRIRFVMVEAEIADGDIGQITQAIQNALRAPTTAVPRITAPANGAKVIAPEVPEVEEGIEVEEEGEAEAASQPSKKGPRKPAPTPEVLELDLTSGTSLTSFAEKANPKSHHKRYLVIAVWFKEHRSTDAITASHVYTCYRALKWPLNINDFAQPLRDLKFKQYFAQREKGSYAINHLGIAEVENLLAGGE